MNELNHALYNLIKRTRLTPAEAAGLTLGDLNLAGSEPQLTVWNEETGRRQPIALDEQTRNALVAWLLVRPDRPVALLFPGEGDEELSLEAIETLLKEVPPPPAPAKSDKPGLTAQTIRDEQLPPLGPLPSKQLPPPFKLTSPPPGPERVVADGEPAAAALQIETPPRRVTPVLVIAGGLGLLACAALLIGGLVVAPRQLARLRGATPTPIAAGRSPTATLQPLAATSPIQPGPTQTSTPAPPPTDTPLPPPPTDTPAPAPPTDTPAPPPPTDTPAPAPPTNTPLPPPSPTPAPTNTPAPTATPPGAPAPPAPSPTPTAGFKYPAPTLISPDPDFVFIAGNTIELKWQPVAELAGNEQYAVRVVYFHNAEVVYRGTNLKDTHWTIPLEFYHDADGPEFAHTWYVYIEAVQPDGSSVPVSPESEHRGFVWK